MSSTLFNLQFPYSYRSDRNNFLPSYYSRFPWHRRHFRCWLRKGVHLINRSRERSVLYISEDICYLQNKIWEPEGVYSAEKQTFYISTITFSQKYSVSKYSVHEKEELRLLIFPSFLTWLCFTWPILSLNFSLELHLVLPSDPFLCEFIHQIIHLDHVGSAITKKLAASPTVK